MANLPTEMFEELAAGVSASTVKVHGRNAGSGTGVILDARGANIVTNAHVALTPSLEVELSDGRILSGEVVARDPSQDLAVIRVNETLPRSMDLADSDSIRVGQIVLAFGHPLGQDRSLAIGVIHATASEKRPFRLLAADIRLQPGYSGGPLIDTAGRLLGINTMVAGGLGLAVPANAVRAFLNLQSRPKLGVALRPVLGPRAGLLVVDVVAGEPADTAGVLIGDILLEIDGADTRTVDDFSRCLANAQATVGLSLLRGEQRTSVHVQLTPNREDVATHARRAA